LRQLLQGDDAEQRLDQRLRSALGYFAGQQSVSPGTRIGPWRVLRSIGQGGMAEVCLAERADGAFERQVALKLLWPGLVHDRAAELVRQERQMLAQLDDPRIAQLLDGGVTESGQPWLAMEFIDGVPIHVHCREQALALPERLRLCIEVVEAVGSAHRQWIAHGDIKPANVLVTTTGQVKLLDFGIGRLLGEASEGTGGEARWRALTPAWASPEQASGHAPTPASDLYQLGLLLQGLIEDRLPAGGRRRRELEAIKACALAESPAQRYASCAALAADLRAWLDHRPVRVMAGQRGYRLRCLLRRRWPLLSALAGLTLLAGLLVEQQWRYSRNLAERHATNAAVLGFLQDLLDRSNPRLSHDEALLSSGMLVEAAAGLENQLADQPAAKVAILNTLGRIHRTRHELLLSRQRYQQALDLARQQALRAEIDVALDGLANVGIWSGDYAQSEALLRELIETRLEAGRDAADIASARLQLADLLHSRGD
ncbi:MAG: serine/threonine protein kinase, partial [Xanthomonadales bacterium]|nr:serine/threonine protein kinase [Xanthomonadales bacterium]